MSCSFNPQSFTFDSKFGIENESNRKSSEHEFFENISLIIADLNSTTCQDVSLKLIDLNSQKKQIEDKELPILNNFLNFEDIRTLDSYSSSLLPFTSIINDNIVDENFYNSISDSTSTNLVNSIDFNLIKPQEPFSKNISLNTSNLIKDSIYQETKTNANHSSSNHSNVRPNVDLPMFEEPNSCTNGSHKSLVSSFSSLNSVQFIENPIAADLFSFLKLNDLEIPMTAETLIETYGCEAPQQAFNLNEHFHYSNENYESSNKNAFLVDSEKKQIEIESSQQQMTNNLNLPVTKQSLDELIPINFFNRINQEPLTKAGTKNDQSSININSMVPLVPGLIQSECKVLEPYSSRELTSNESLPIKSFSFQSLKQKLEFIKDSNFKNSHSEIQSIETNLNSSQIIIDNSLDLIEEVKYFKCKLCNNTSLLKTAILDHILKVHHLKLDHTQKPVAPTYFCSKCFESFSSLENCHEHMFIKHKLKSQKFWLQQINEKENDQREKKEIKVNNEKIEQDLKMSHKIKRILPNNAQFQTEKLFTNCVKNILSQRSQLTSSNQPLLLKKKIKKEDGSLICQYKGCNIRFKCPNNLQYHQKCHNDLNSGFICAQCDTNFDHWSSLAGHLWRIHLIDMELNKCDFCSYRTYSLSVLENIHKRIHFNERNFICEICKKGFKNHKQLINHRVKHRTQVMEGKEKEISSDHNCNLCGRTFNDSRLLRTHFDIVHKKLRPFICTDCGHTSASRSALRAHLRSHTGEKPFKCEICSYSTSDHNSLRRHKMRHSGEKPYKCPFCSYACIQSSTYKQHLRNKHPGMDQGLMFICSFCQFKTVNQQVYKTHLSEHNLNQINLVN